MPGSAGGSPSSTFGPCLGEPPKAQHTRERPFVGCLSSDITVPRLPPARARLGLTAAACAPSRLPHTSRGATCSSRGAGAPWRRLLHKLLWLVRRRRYLKPAIEEAASQEMGRGMRNRPSSLTVSNYGQVLCAPCAPDEAGCEEVKPATCSGALQEIARS